MDTSEILDCEAPPMSDADFEDSFRRLNTDIGYFSEAMFGLPLQPKQRLFCQCALDHTHTMGCFSRQSGKSTGDAVLDCKWLTLGDHGKVALIGAYAPKFDQAHQIMFMQVVAFLESQPILEELIDYKNYSRGILQMVPGHELRTFTAEKTSKVRGHRITIAQVDETQDITDEKLYTEILPSGAAAKRWVGGRVEEGLMMKRVETGTPGGRNHMYEDICKGKVITELDQINYLEPHDIAVVYQPYWESTVLSAETIAIAKDNYPPNLFEQEYECKFNFDTAFAFPWDQVESSCINKNRNFTRDDQSWYFGGVDLGKNKDHTVLSIFKWRAPMYDMVFHKQWDLHLKWSEILDGVLNYMAIWKPNRTLFDITGPVGEALYYKLLAELPDDYYGGIHGYKYDPKSKLELIYNVQRLLEKGWVRMWDDPQLIRQFRILPEDRTGDKPKFEKPKGEHDDRVHSVALALMGGKQVCGNAGEKASEGISYDRSKKSLWSQFDGHPAQATKVDEGIPIGYGGYSKGLGSIFDRKDLWEGL
jgi:hypothetical protein